MLYPSCVTLLKIFAIHLDRGNSLWLFIILYMFYLAGEPDCSGRGTCATDNDPPRCVDCQPGWMGLACDELCVNGTQVPPNRCAVMSCFIIVMLK